MTGSSWERRFKPIIFILLAAFSAKAVQVGPQAFGAKPVPGSCKHTSPPQQLRPGVLTYSSVEPLTCELWSISTSDVQASSECSPRLNSYVVLEFWAIAWGKGRDRAKEAMLPPAMQVVDDIYMIMTKGSKPTMVTIDEHGRTIQADTSMDGFTRIDKHAWMQRRSYQAVQMRWHDFAYNETDMWTVTIANLHPQRRTLGKYAIRISCHATLSCPSAAPQWGVCSDNVTTSLTGQVIGMQQAMQELGGSAMPAGECKPYPQDQVRTCQCSRGWGDYACSSSVVNMSDITTTGTSVRGGPDKKLLLPPRTWQYIWVAMPKGPRPRLLLEVSQPAGSGSTLDPIVVVSAAHAQDENGIWKENAVPTLENIHFKTREHSQELDVPRRYAPIAYRADEDAAYVPESLWVGILNNAPFTGAHPGAAANTVMLRVRNDGGGASGTPLCPMDCMNRGFCQEPPPGSSASYMCRCNVGFGGDFCQGQLTPLVLDSVQPYTSGWVTMTPGQWDFYQVSVAPGLSTTLQAGRSSYSTLAIDLQVDGQPQVDKIRPINPTRTYFSNDNLSGQVYLIVTPHTPGKSVGEDFYDSPSNLTSSFAGTTSLVLGADALSQYTSWMVVVYASDLDPPLTESTYSLSVRWQPSEQKSETSDDAKGGIPWYAVFIGAAVGSVILTLTGVTVARLVLWRVQQHRVRAGAIGGMAAAAAALQGMQMNPSRRQKGVPHAVIATFPLIQYSTPDKLAAFVQSIMPSSEPTSESGAVSDATNCGANGGTNGGGQDGRQNTTNYSSSNTVQMVNPLTSFGSSVDWRTLADVPGGRTGVQVWTSSEGGLAAGNADGVGTGVPTSPRARGGAATTGGDMGVLSGRFVVSGSLWRHALNVDWAHAPSCSVCICEYEVGDLLRVLRPCAHPFHKNCIDTWLEAHDTCPMCRVDLCAAAAANVTTSSNGTLGSQISLISGQGGAYSGRLPSSRRIGMGSNTFPGALDGMTSGEQQLSLIGAAQGGDALPSWHVPADVQQHRVGFLNILGVSTGSGSSGVGIGAGTAGSAAGPGPLSSGGTAAPSANSGVLLPIAPPPSPRNSPRHGSNAAAPLRPRPSGSRQRRVGGWEAPAYETDAAAAAGATSSSGDGLMLFGAGAGMAGDESDAIGHHHRAGTDIHMAAPYSRGLRRSNARMEDHPLHPLHLVHQHHAGSGLRAATFGPAQHAMGSDEPLTPTTGSQVRIAHPDSPKVATRSSHLR